MIQANFTNDISHNINNLSTWIQNKWQVGSQCQVYSDNSWYKGVIIKRISNNSSYGNKLFEIQYTAENTARTKQVMNDDIESLRPISEAMTIYKYIYNAIYPEKTSIDAKQKQLHLPKAKSIIFQNPLGYSYPYNWYDCDELSESLAYLQLNHLKMKSIKTIPLRVLKPSQQTLISLYSSYRTISQFLKETICFSSLETLCIECHKINDSHLIPYHVFGQDLKQLDVTAKFPRLKYLTFKKQSVKASFINLLSVISTLPVLVRFEMEYCKFINSKSTTKVIYNNHKSKTIQSLYFNTIHINKQRLSHIADCFGDNLKDIKFNQCAIPMKQKHWAYFANNCHVLRSIFCTKLCSSITSSLPFENGQYTLKCKKNTNDNLFNISLNQAFKHKSNINIVVEKQKSVQKHHAIRHKTWNDLQKDRQRWKLPKEYEECKLCGSNVGIDCMNDHLDSICANQIIQCILCNKDVKRCDLTGHWENSCDKYIRKCNTCSVTFKNKDKYYEHRLWHSNQEDILKRRYFFGNVHSLKHRQEFCDDKCIELAWKCNKCQRLCIGKRSIHKCPKWCINWDFYNFSNICKLCNSSVPIGKMIDHLENICVNETIKCYLCNEQLIRRNLVKHWKECVGYERSNKPLSMMRFTVPALYGKHVISYWIRKEIENKYNLYSHIPEEIFKLVSTFFAESHDFRKHKAETLHQFLFSLRQCKICYPKQIGVY